MTSLPPIERIPATPADALIKTNPITPEMAAIMAPRILKKTVREGDCWLRTTCLNAPGYSGASLTVDGRQRFFLAHRVMYVHTKGVIPDGHTIDHLCEHRNCVNPEHLQAVTHRQNVLRSRTNPFAVNARRKRERNGDAA